MSNEMWYPPEDSNYAKFWRGSKPLTEKLMRYLGKDRIRVFSGEYGVGTRFPTSGVAGDDLLRTEVHSLVPKEQYFTVEWELVAPPRVCVRAWNTNYHEGGRDDERTVFINISKNTLENILEVIKQEAFEVAEVELAAEEEARRKRQREIKISRYLSDRLEME